MNYKKGWIEPLWNALQNLNLIIDIYQLL